ncbi:hypothetical protein Syun_000983 [Stephania yunnanensis]|uniref:Uncharacterized protein n=1 Tax=Stephania yunnanensis TaxID=152371 RepID=A0AAP0LE24_9MAGN
MRRYGLMESERRGDVAGGDMGLVEATVAIEDLDEGVVDAVFEANEEVKVVEANIGVDDDDWEAEAGKGNSYVDDGGGLADSAFAQHNDHHA